MSQPQTESKNEATSVHESSKTKRHKRKRNKASSSNSNPDPKPKNPKITTVVSVPVNPTKASSNWKQLLSLPGGPGSGHPPRKPKKVPYSKADQNQTKPPQIDLKSLPINQLGFLRYDSQGKTSVDPSRLPPSFIQPTGALAIDCEFVGVGPQGTENALARVSVVNEHGYCLYDKFVKPKVPITDYRTEVSGVRPENMTNAEKFETARTEVYSLMKDALVVGHDLRNDFKTLQLFHHKSRIRDTSLYFKKRMGPGGLRPSLRKLCSKLLGVQIQSGEHNSIEDAQAAMKLYLKYKKEWEATGGRRPGQLPKHAKNSKK